MLSCWAKKLAYHFLVWSSCMTADRFSFDFGHISVQHCPTTNCYCFFLQQFCLWVCVLLINMYYVHIAMLVMLALRYSAPLMMIKNMIIFKLQVEKVWCGLLTLVDEVLLPSISLLECNSSLAEELWAMMCRFPYELRWVNPCTTPSVIGVLLPLFHSNLLCKFKERGIFSGNNHRTSMSFMLYGVQYFLE